MQRQQHRQHREQHRARNFEMGVEQVHEDRRGGRDRERGEDHRSRPVPLRIGDRKQNLRQPGRRDPGLALSREGIEVGVGQGVVIEDPLTDLDLPERVGVLKQRVADIEEEEIGTRADTQRHQCPRAALHCDAVGEGKGHAASCCSWSCWPSGRHWTTAVITSSKSAEMACWVSAQFNRLFSISVYHRRIHAIHSVFTQSN